MIESHKHEKGDQVSLMGQIYSKATRVLICLGGDDGGHARQAESFLREFSHWFKQTLDDLPGERPRFPHPEPAASLLDRDPRWASVAALAQKPWFRRGWVVQEAALAKYGDDTATGTCLLWGDAAVGWLWLMRAAVWLITRGGGDKAMAALEGGDGGNGGGGGGWLLDGLRVHVNQYTCVRPNEANRLFQDEMMTTRRRLLQTLYDARRLGFSDDRDRIYAFLGLPQARGVRARLGVDYRLPAGEVMRRFADAHLADVKRRSPRGLDLGLLHYAQLHSVDPYPEACLPSWVPRWGSAVSDEVIYMPNDKAMMPPRETGKEMKYTPRVVNDVLTVRGVIMDTISRCPQLSKNPKWKDAMTIWRDFCQHETVYDSVSRPLAFIEAITCGRTKEERERATGESLLCLLEHGADAVSPASLERPLLSEWVSARRIHNRTFATTSKGYYCSVPRETREGDVCAIIYGTKTPFVLRRAGAEYKLVGRAYMVSAQPKKQDEERPGRRGCATFRGQHGSQPRRQNESGRECVGLRPPCNNKLQRVGTGPCAFEDWSRLQLQDEDILLR